MFLFRSGLDLAPLQNTSVYPVQAGNQVWVLFDRGTSWPIVKIWPRAPSMTQVKKDHHAVFGLATPPLRLLAASFTVDPYIKLFSPYRRVSRPPARQRSRAADNTWTRRAEDKDRSPRSSNSRVGRPPNWPTVAPKPTDRPRARTKKPVIQDSPVRVWQAELHHRLGVSWEAAGNLEKAKSRATRLAGETSNSRKPSITSATCTASWAKAKCARVLREGRADAPQLRNRPI